MIQNTLGVAVGMMDCTFKHYYRKYAVYEDMKNTGVQEVIFVGEVEVEE